MEASPRPVKQVIYIYEDEAVEPQIEPDTPNYPEKTSSKAICCCKNSKPISLANPRIGFPGSLACFGFGWTVVLVNLSVAGVYEFNIYTSLVSIIFGGVIQFVGGFLELINMNTYGCILCSGYGAYNLITGMASLFPSSTKVPSAFMGTFFFTWFFFALTCFVGGLKGCLVGTAINAVVVCYFFLLSIAKWLEDDEFIKIVGFIGVVAGGAAIYLSMALSFSLVYGRNILPLIDHDNFRNFRW